eukprot:2412803-Amphidinium_carterae.3
MEAEVDLPVWDPSHARRWEGFWELAAICLAWSMIPWALGGPVVSIPVGTYRGKLTATCRHPTK